MVFKKRAELGERDPNIYDVDRDGPRSRGKPRTRREQYQGELLTLLRKFKPHNSDAIKTAVKIMENAEATDSNKLRASALIIQTYRDLLKDLYNGVDMEETAEEIQDTRPTFSLRVIDNPDHNE